MPVSFSALCMGRAPSCDLGTAAAKRWPNAKFTLRNGARIIEKTWPTHRGRSNVLRPVLCAQKPLVSGGFLEACQCGSVSALTRDLSVFPNRENRFEFVN